MPVHLETSNLSALPDTVARPQYRRSDLRPGILHIGVGNFHRAHQAVYLDALFNTGRDHDWAIVGAGIKPFDATRRTQLHKQDWLTTVIELDPRGPKARITGSMMDFSQCDGPAILDWLARPDIRIVSLTITEGGYYIDAAGNFDAAHPEMVQDAATPDAPQTVFGLLLAGLIRRRDAGLAAFTVLSCDNLPENGHVTRQATLGLAAMISDDLHDWVANNVAFPNSMVDCITPATSDRERAMVTDRFGITDAAPVACEPFRQWVMEDNFPLGRPALEHVGVEFVPNVTPYETMKLRILNAGHAAIAYPAALLGYEFVHDAMADADIVHWLKHLMHTEVIPILPPIRGIDYDAYLSTCIERFSNPAVGDTVARLCLDGSNRQPKFVLPTLTEALQAGHDIDGLVLEVAMWCRYCAASAIPLSNICLVDERADRLAAAAIATRDDPQAFLRLDDVFGNLADNPRFSDGFAKQIAQLWAKPPRHVLRQFLNNTGS